MNSLGQVSIVLMFFNLFPR